MLTPIPDYDLFVSYVHIDNEGEHAGKVRADQLYDRATGSPALPQGAARDAVRGMFLDNAARHIFDEPDARWCLSLENMSDETQ